MSLLRRLRAPGQHGAIVAEPPLADAERLVAANRRQLEQVQLHLLGQPLNDLRRQARRAAVAQAKEYFQQGAEPIADFGDGSLIMAGHQPELFHPGVWVKNFALNGLARAVGATPLTLIVDNDTAKTTSLRLPAPGSGEHALPHVVSLPYDQWTGEVPYEERKVSDDHLFATLPERAEPIVRAWPFVPLLAVFWAEARRHAERTSLLGERLVAARRSFERRWGCHNLEVPVSRLCRTESFAWFACHLLSDLPRFHAIYNDCVSAYRRRYGIRSRNHPVPELVREGDWLESPFWAWRSGRKERGRLLARRTGSVLALRVDAEPWPELSTGAGQEPALVREWLALEQRGFKIRTRALTNTLFARLFLSDLFIHGIGGGNYDELTDEIARRFYGYELPGYLVLSATLLLPLPAYSVDMAECRRLAARLRDLYWNPQRYLDGTGTSSAPDLADEKQAWIAQQPTTKQARRKRFEALRELTKKLRPFVTGQIRRLAHQKLRCDHELQANAILQRRDYAFSLYPEPMLRSFCTQFLDFEGPR